MINSMKDGFNLAKRQRGEEIYRLSSTPKGRDAPIEGREGHFRIERRDSLEEMIGRPR